MKDYRLLENRWKGFKSYFYKEYDCGEYNYFNLQIKEISKIFNFTNEEKCWFAYLFSICYCLPTAWILFYEFPSYKKINAKEFEKYWNETKKKLVFSSDKAKVKNFDMPPKMIESYKTIMGINQFDRVQKSLVLGDKQTSYNNLYALCDKFYNFGRFSIDMYVETLTNILELEVEMPKVNWKDSSNESIKNGLLYALALDEYITLHHKKPEKILQKEDFDYLDLMLEKLYKQIDNEVKVDKWVVCAVLCGWKKMFWGVRYVGYYLDRQLEQTLLTEELNSDIPFLPIWKTRKELLDNNYLGEVNGWKGIRKEKITEFINTGNL